MTPNKTIMLIYNIGKSWKSNTLQSPGVSVRVVDNSNFIVNHGQAWVNGFYNPLAINEDYY